MLRLIPKHKRRRQQPATNVQQTEVTLEDRRVLSAITAAVAEVGDSMVNHSNESSSTELVSASQKAVTARVINGESTSDYAAVGIVNNGCTGTLIAPDVVLTAAHCVEASGGGYIGDTEGTFEVNGQVYNTTKITVHPDYNPNNFGAGYDIAIMKLDRAVEGVTPHDINRTVPVVGQTLTLVGFGETGSSSSGGSNGDFGNKTVGQTAIDEVTQTHVSWNFDSHNESNTAPGDSGGPAFLEFAGKLVVAGITSGGDGEAGQLGDFSFDTRVDTLADWIDSVAGTTSDGDGNNGDNGNGDNGNGDNGSGNGDTGGGDNNSNSGTFGSLAAVSIPDDQQTTVSSTAVASGLNGNITDVNVTLNIQHTWNEDLTITLISPSGTRIELLDGVGGDGDNFNNTQLDESAQTSILNGNAPFTGTYRPTGDLSTLNGEDPNGTWTLEVQDHFEEDGGQITNFAVSIETDGAAAGNTGDGGDGDNTGGDNTNLNQLAIQIDQQLELSTNGNYFENWGGRNEKWMTSNDGWVFITPDGGLYKWTGNGANGQLLAMFSPAFHESPELLHEAYDNSQGDSPTDLAAKAIETDQQYGLRTTGNLWEDWAGLGEKWMYGNTGWMFITPDGSLYEAFGNNDGSDKLVATFSSEYHADPSLLYNAYDNTQREKRTSDSLFELVGSGSDNLLTVL